MGSSTEEAGRRSDSASSRRGADCAGGSSVQRSCQGDGPRDACSVQASQEYGSAWARPQIRRYRLGQVMPTVAVIVCGAPLARRVTDIVTCLKGNGMVVLVVGTPSSKDWL